MASIWHRDPIPLKKKTCWVVLPFWVVLPKKKCCFERKMVTDQKDFKKNVNFGWPRYVYCIILQWFTIITSKSFMTSSQKLWSVLFHAKDSTKTESIQWLCSEKIEEVAATLISKISGRLQTFPAWCLFVERPTFCASFLLHPSSTSRLASR